MNTTLNKTLALIFVLSLLPIFSFTQVKREVSAYIGGGLSTLNLDHSNSGFGDQLGTTFGLGYNHFLNQVWSIVTGLEYSTYRSRVFISNINGEVSSIDNEKEAFLYQYSAGGYSEKQVAGYLNIPIMAQYQGEKLRGFYVALGAKFGLPVFSSYTGNISAIQAQGFYPITNVTYTDLLFRGFGRFADRTTKSSLDLKPAVFLSIDLGKKFKVGENLHLYAGCYFDYGLNSIAKNTTPFINYNAENPQFIQNNSALNSEYFTSEGVSQSMVDKARPWALGVKLRLALDKF